LTTLRRQIAELQQSQQIKSIEASISGSSSKPNTMSWLKFTDNLTKIKDEVANFATEVLAPDLPPDEAGAQALDPNEMKKKEISEQQIQELTNLCATQDAEVSFE
uniref:CSON010547 protein n=1 Tax=Culicoides sonorensis TaxID=179676 RepID=A0A336LEQ2_CULSO